jgi:integrase
MRGKIFKQPHQAKGSYTIVISLGLDPATGKRKQQWVTVRGSKHDAERRLAEILHQIDTGSFNKPGKTTVAEFLARWLAEYSKPNLSSRSYERYAGIVRTHLIPALGGMPLTQLKPEHLQKHYAALLDKGLAARTVRYDHVVLHCALRLACKWGLLTRNVADSVDVPRAQRGAMQTWDEWEMAQFLEAAKTTPYHALFYTNLYTGMRRSELLALSWRHVDLLYCQISVERGLHRLSNGEYSFTQPKSAKSRRTIALPPSLSLILKEHRANQERARILTGKPLTEDDLVFAHDDGSPLSPNSVSRAWDLLAKAAAVKPIRFHDARHTHATLLLKQGVHPKIVQERLGHSTIATTLDTYSHVSPGLQEAAAARFDAAMSDAYNGHVENHARQ